MVGKGTICCGFRVGGLVIRVGDRGRGLISRSSNSNGNSDLSRSDQAKREAKQGRAEAPQVGGVVILARATFHRQ